tara:strand:- start:48 stop:389 length:342 start_codon:yes stop_codon:yes gene_type:complete
MPHRVEREIREAHKTGYWDEEAPAKWAHDEVQTNGDVIKERLRGKKDKYTFFSLKEFRERNPRQLVNARDRRKLTRAAQRGEVAKPKGKPLFGFIDRVVGWMKKLLRFTPDDL